MSSGISKHPLHWSALKPSSGGPRVKNEIIIVKKDKVVIKSRYGTRIYYQVGDEMQLPEIELKPGGKIKLED